MTKIENGAKVWFRGLWAKDYCVRGVIEDVDCYDERIYGIRLENGNYIRAYPDQITGRD